MARRAFRIVILLVLILHETREDRFVRRIQAIGYPYYKILMTLGTCKEKVLFFDQKTWAKIKLNRVLDIYYRSNNERYKVSRVEILLVINNTRSFAYSETGVGGSEFSGTLYLPTNVGFIIYNLHIYTCSHDDSLPVSDNYDDSTYLPFYRKNYEIS